MLSRMWSRVRPPVGLPVDEGAGDLVVAVGVVVEHPGGERHRRVQQRVADRLRARGLLEEVAEAGLPELGALLGSGLLLVGVGRLRRPAQRRHEQVGVDGDQPLGRQAGHRVGDRRADVTALGDVAGVAEALHQLRPDLCDAAGPPAELGRLGREPVPGDGRQHEVERILGVVRRGQRLDRLEQLDHRARPAVGHDQRQRVLVLGAHVDEVDVDPVDLGDELRQRVQPLGDAAEVVLVRPVVGERLQRRQLDPLRAVVDQLLARPARRLRCDGAGRPALPPAARRGRA